jgi:hypothetical protein
LHSWIRTPGKFAVKKNERKKKKKKRREKREGQRSG